MKQSLLTAALVIVASSLLTACSEDKTPTKQTANETVDVKSIETDAVKPVTQPSSSSTGKPATTRDESEFQQLYRLIVYGQANFNQVKTALKSDDVGELVNVVHALYSMRWLRGVTNMLKAVWEMDQDAYPELNWDKLQQTPVRIAVASTINRIKVFDTQEYRAFIREHKYDEHEFHRAQVVVALGLNQDPVDVDYLTEMVNGDNIYVSQSAITSLALMNNEPARDALIELANKHKDTPRGQLIIEVLKKAYDMVPTDTSTATAG